VDLWYYRSERLSRSVLREKREPQAGPASRLSKSASIIHDASGDGVCLSEPNTKRTAEGEVLEGLPGSKSVARMEGEARNRGGPDSPCRTNYEGQAGRPAQRQGARAGSPGVGSAHSIGRQGASPEAGEGADTLTQSAQETRTVRVTEQDWQTFLRAIAEKACKDKHHRFGDLYRWLNQDVLRLCFYRLRKDAASGVDGVTLDPYSYYTLAAEGWSKSCGWVSKTRMRRPFCLPQLTWTTESSPRFTRCMIVCRETPRMRMASGIAT